MITFLSPGASAFLSVGKVTGVAVESGDIPADAYRTPDGSDYYQTPDGSDYYAEP